MKELTFTTRRIEAAGEMPAISAQIITARPEDRVDTKGRPRGEDWWGFGLLRDSVLVDVYIAIADGLDVKGTMRETAEYLLATHRDETCLPAGRLETRL